MTDHGHQRAENNATHSHADYSHPKHNHWIGTAIFLTLLLVATLQISKNSAGFMSFCNNFLRLTDDDVNMIPVGVVLYFSFWLIADKLLIQPHLALVEKREELTSGSEQGAKEILKTIALKNEQYLATIATARAQASAGNKEKTDQVRKQVAEDLSVLNKEVDQQVAEELTKLKASQSEIRSRLFANANTLVTDLVTKVQTAGL